MLEKKKILIIGGSSGIGLAVAKQASRLGAQVVVASRQAAAQKQRLADVLQGAWEAHSFDITSVDDQARLLAATGRIDHLVITVRPDIKPAPFPVTNIDEARRAFDTKFWGQYRLIQAAQPFMDRCGSITLTSGIAGEKIYKGSATMAIINSATETLCRALAVELAPLRVNTVSPGFVEPKPREVQDYAGQFPMQRLASVDEVAMAYISLMTNPYATGTVSVIDGGARLI